MPHLLSETIRRHLDEAPCDCCGAPLYVGDRAFVDLDRGAIYCGRLCAAADQEQPAPARFDAVA